MNEELTELGGINAVVGHHLSDIYFVKFYIVHCPSYGCITQQRSPE